MTSTAQFVAVWLSPIPKDFHQSWSTRMQMRMRTRMRMRTKTQKMLLSSALKDVMPKNSSKNKELQKNQWQQISFTAHVVV